MHQGHSVRHEAFGRDVDALLRAINKIEPIGIRAKLFSSENLMVAAILTGMLTYPHWDGWLDKAKSIVSEMDKRPALSCWPHRRA